MLLLIKNIPAKEVLGIAWKNPVRSKIVLAKEHIEQVLHFLII